MVIWGMVIIVLPTSIMGYSIILFMVIVRYC
jgi:hypothetical protein